MLYFVVQFRHKHCNPTVLYMSATVKYILLSTLIVCFMTEREIIYYITKHRKHLWKIQLYYYIPMETLTTV